MPSGEPHGPTAGQSSDGGINVQTGGMEELIEGPSLMQNAGRILISQRDIQCAMRRSTPRSSLCDISPDSSFRLFRAPSSRTTSFLRSLVSSFEPTSTAFGDLLRLDTLFHLLDHCYNDRLTHFTIKQASKKTTRRQYSRNFTRCRGSVTLEKGHHRRHREPEC